MRSIILNKLLFIFICILICSVNTAHAQTKAIPAKKTVVTTKPAPSDTIPQKDYYLELKGYVRHLKGSENEKENDVKPLDSTLITIYNGDVPYSELWTNKKGKCSFKLPLDKTFKIEITKQGFVTKHIMVNTKVPYDNRGTFTFNFDVDLFEVVKGLDVSVLNNPIAKVAYRVSEETFAYDVGYTSKINADLKKMYKNYYRLQAIEKDSVLFQTDSTKVSLEK
jgi:hypothetical protein